ncbi:hypothetical protein ACQY0O_005677 [Thecaphora frezii]
MKNQPSGPADITTQERVKLKRTHYQPGPAYTGYSSGMTSDPAYDHRHECGGGWMNAPQAEAQVHAQAQAQAHAHAHPNMMPPRPDEYAAQMGVWQPPHAPRMSAAAARASTFAAAHAAGGPGWFTGHPQPFNGGHLTAQSGIPWYGAMGHPMAPRQPQTHQDLEHQLILHHQLSKLQQNGHLQAHPGPGALVADASAYAHPHPYPYPQPRASRCEPANNRRTRDWPQRAPYPGMGHSRGRSEHWTSARSQRCEPPDHINHAIRRAEAHRTAQEWQEGAYAPAWNQAADDADAEVVASDARYAGHGQYGPVFPRQGEAAYDDHHALTGYGQRSNGNVPSWDPAAAHRAHRYYHPASIANHDQRQQRQQQVQAQAQPNTQQHWNERGGPPTTWYDDDVQHHRYESTTGYTRPPLQHAADASNSYNVDGHPRQPTYAHSSIDSVTDAWSTAPQQVNVAQVAAPRDSWNADFEPVDAVEARRTAETVADADWNDDTANQEQQRRLDAVVYASQDQSHVPPPSAEMPDAQSKGPAPPSPDTLDKSSVPIAAFGAQVVWNACAAFFDADVLRQAQQVEAKVTASGRGTADGDEDRSNATTSVPSSSSTPSIGTPLLSPWATASLPKGHPRDWNAFESPFGPDGAAPLRTASHELGLSASNALVNTDSVSQLHRLAVVGAGARAGNGSRLHNSSSTGVGSRRAARHRTSSGQREFMSGYVSAGGHSSCGSSATSSEPGTPSSLGSHSPSVNSIVATQSDGANFTAAHPAPGLGLDRSQSESAVYPHSVKTRTMSNSSRWASRARENILSALRLVSPQWRWSANPEKFASLVTASDRFEGDSMHTSPALGASSQRSRAPRDPAAGVVSAHASEPSPAFRRFAHQVLAQTLLSPTAFLLGILYALRLPYLVQLADGSIDPEAMELFAQPTSAAPFKLFTLGMMIANKHLDDNTFTNKTWNEVTGIPLLELNQIEAYFLKKCNYEVSVPDETWVAFLQNVKAREELRALDDRLDKSADAALRDEGRRASFDRALPAASSDQDCRKRVLLVLEDALAAFEAATPFSLDDDCPVVDSGSPDFADTCAAPVDEKGAWGRMQQRRPESMLHAHHQHCRSAPTVVRSNDGNVDDVFDDEHSPFRPSQHGRQGDGPHDARGILSRTQSDYDRRYCRLSAPLRSHAKFGR